MKRVLLLAALVFGTPATAQTAPALPMPPLPAPPGDPRFQTIEYHADRVVQIQVAPGYQLTLELAPDERVESVALGDSAAWQVSPNRHGDHLFIKPLQSDVTTNMTVVTDVRTYLFDLVPLPGPQPTMAYILRFDYPGATQAPEETLVAAVETTYRVSGTRALRPSAMSDDGLRTYIEWPPDASLPAVYAVDGEGHEILVNGMMRDGVFVIDSILPKLVFRIDRQTAQAVRQVPRGKR